MNLLKIKYEIEIDVLNDLKNQLSRLRLFSFINNVTMTEYERGLSLADSIIESEIEIRNLIIKKYEK